MSYWEGVLRFCLSALARALASSVVALLPGKNSRARSVLLTFMAAVNA